MTEQEAEAMTARLERIWGEKGATIKWTKGTYSWVMNLEVPEGNWITITLYIEAADLSIVFGREGQSSRLSFQDGEVEWQHWPGTEEEEETFAAQWLPSFRRNCWLSGLPIEATAHEKAEWIQGFTQEEIEA